MRALLLLALVAVPAFAQVPPAELGQRNVPAPWWMRDPVIAARGLVRVELPANRARFTVRFKALDREAAAATAAAAKQVRDIDRSLRALGADRVRLTTTFSVRPIYDQYREKDGTLVENQRADKIDRYEVTASVAITIRDMALLERAYRTVLAGQPTGIDAVNFDLDPDNATTTWLQTEAVKDAARRARLAVEAGGSRLGAAKIIDPSGSVCQSQVLAGWPSYGSSTSAATVTRPERLDRFAS